MSKLLEFPDPYRNRRQHTIFEDFHWFVSSHLWTLVPGADGGTGVITGVPNGILTMTASGAGTDNLQDYLKTTSDVIKWADDKPVLAEARLKYTEANVSAANIMFGLMDAVGANSIVDNGGGPKASFSGAVIYKVDGGTVWRACSSVGAARTDTVSGKSSISTNYQVLRIECKPLTSALLQVSYFVDNGDGTGPEPLKDALGNVILHNVDMTSAVAMGMFVGVKNGSANIESVLVDYMAMTALR